MVVRNDIRNSSHDSDNRKKDIIVKTIIMLLLSFIVFIFAAVAWFAMNRDTTAGGMSVRMADQGFELRVADGTIAYNDLYALLDASVRGTTNVQTSSAENGQIIRWRMSQGEEEIQPGSQGVLEFDVISTGADVTAIRYSLHVSAYEAVTHIDQTTEEEVVDSLTEITSSSTSADARKGLSFINTHIMFFTGRNGTSADNYEYYGFISDKDDFELTLDANNHGVIYWIWPNTFGQIALLASDTGYISGTPLLYSAAASYEDDRDAVTEYMQNNASDFFNGSDNYSSLITSLYNKRKAGTSYSSEFERLSEGYNSADQTIGQNVDYALVHMVANLR